MSASQTAAKTRQPRDGVALDAGVAIEATVDPVPDADHHRRLTIEQAFMKLLDLKSRTFLL